MKSTRPERYPINKQIIKEYLYTLDPDDAAGIVADAANCPVARAMQHKYGIPFVATEWHCVPKTERPSIDSQTPPDIAELIRAIDRAGNPLEPISRSEVEGVLGL